MKTHVDMIQKGFSIFFSTLYIYIDSYKSSGDLYIYYILYIIYILYIFIYYIYIYIYILYIYIYIYIYIPSACNVWIQKIFSFNN